MLPLALSQRFPLVPRFNTGSGVKALLANQDGLPCYFPQVAIEIATLHDEARTLPFFYDTGSDLMVIPVYVARHHGIRYREEYPGTMISSVGGSARCFYDFVQVRSSLIRENAPLGLRLCGESASPSPRPRRLPGRLCRRHHKSTPRRQPAGFPGPLLETPRHEAARPYSLQRVGTDLTGKRGFGPWSISRVVLLWRVCGFLLEKSSE